MCHHQSMVDPEDQPGLREIRPAAPDEEHLARSRVALTATDGDGDQPSTGGERGENRRARVEFVLVTALAGLAWLGVGLLVLLAVAAYQADVSENMTGMAVAGLLPLILPAAFGLTAASAWCYRGIRGGRAWLRQLLCSASSMWALLLDGRPSCSFGPDC
jgi:hypothetical protein